MKPPKTIPDYIRTIPDYPHAGILFRDVTPLCADPQGFRLAVDQLTLPFTGQKIDKVIGPEARGFLLGGAVAHQLSAGFAALRKQGKLPPPVIAQSYALEYGEAVVELSEHAITPGDQVLLVDDLIATGGTAEAAVALVERLGGTVSAAAFIVDLPDLGGRKRLEALGVRVHTLVAYEGL
ncbi:adenine phosphoribosyltransferase [Alloyangia pacifica]|uniref:Adenine phosphoribosyltransferase n=1 Tax=Alloyangia pacifica TaxID=311180 RepID=A0A1I6TK11_9RHOB|nr:adenine phosphoribosyltransferase [Alloyangia pacifica]SDH15732.1 adenine phosphoribosyltransferase [Alloyangia pacifica]SFS89478.1 adenine phosphoribosyltransferase [Alloyangia pacifica]